MKKVFYFSMLLIAAMVFTGCPAEPETTYTFKFNIDPEGIDMTAIVYEYDGSEVVGQKSFNCTKGLKQVVTVNEKAKKVKVKVILGHGSNSITVWVIKVYYLEHGKNIDVELTENSRFLTYEPPF